MNPESKLLKDLFQGGDQCPDPSDLAELRAGAKSRRFEFVRAHADACPKCQAELALLAALERAPSAAEKPDVDWIAARLRASAPAAPGKSRGKLPWWRSLWTAGEGLRTATALAGVLAIGGAVLYWERQTLSPVDTQSPRMRDTYRSGAEIANLQPTGKATTAPAKLAWQPAPGVASYDVSVFEVDRSVLWSARTAASELAVPAEVRAAMLPGKMLLWEVRGFDSEGRQVATSARQELQVEKAAR